MIALLLSTAIAALTVQIEGVGTFYHYQNVNYNAGLFTFTDFDCIHDLVFGDGFEAPNVIRFTTPMGEVIPLAAASINGQTINLKPRYPSSVICHQRVIFSDGLEGQ